jgi:DNA repair protein RecO (recombination protein O)
MAARAERSRKDHQPAFILHSYPFRETSLVVETFTRDHGRVALVARGARRPKSALRGVLLAFQPLLVSWTGKSELHTLVAAEWEGSYAPLRGEALMCGFYLNELMLRLLPRDDAHEGLYASYRDALAALAITADHAAVLRRFELRLLGELGYAVMLDREADSGTPIAAEQRYVYVIERGPLPMAGRPEENGVELAGQTLLDMQSGNFASSATAQQSKVLMRALINHCLGNQVLHTRQLLRDLHEL